MVNGKVWTAREFMEPYAPHTVCDPALNGFPSHVIQLITPLYMLMELVEAEYLCIDVKHNVIATTEYGKLHHFTAVRWSEDLLMSEVVSRALINSQTIDTLGQVLIQIFTMAERTTGVTPDFFRVYCLTLSVLYCYICYNSC